MFQHPEILFDLATQHRSELIAEASRANQARDAKRARSARHARRREAAAGTDADGHRVSARAGSLVSCGVVGAEPVR